jgi:hypothetical protein
LQTWLAFFATVLSTTISCSAYAQTLDTTAQLNDLSDKDSPLHATGQASFHTALSMNKERLECSVVGNVTNISSKTVVAFEASLELSSEGSGCVHADYTIDYIFDRNLLAPGSHYDLIDRSPAGETDYSGTRAAREPQAQFRVQFVQFADGSSFGSSLWSERLESERRTKVELMKSLLHSFDAGDVSALTTDVKDRLARPGTPRYLDALLRKTSETIEQKGADAAIDDLHEWLTNAEKRGNLFNFSGG